MRKTLISILLGLLVVWTVYFMICGVEAINVKGFIGLKDENESLEKRIEALRKTINSSYQNALTTLDSTKDNLIDSKTEYENQAELSSLNNSSYTSEKYPIEYLWTRLGNFAKDEQIVIKMDVSETDIKDLYDLTITAAGTYSGIKDFIYDIENDSKLGFKIDDFTMSGASQVVTATFNCNEIHIDLNKNEETEKEENDEESDEGKDKEGNDIANTTNENTTKDENVEKKTEENETQNDETTTEKKEVKVDREENDVVALYNEMMGTR